MDTLVITLTLIGIGVWTILASLKVSVGEKYKNTLWCIVWISRVLGVGGMIWSSFIIGGSLAVPVLLNIVLSTFLVLYENKNKTLILFKLGTTWWCILILLYNLVF